MNDKKVQCLSLFVVFVLFGQMAFLIFNGSQQDRFPAASGAKNKMSAKIFEQSFIEQIDGGYVFFRNFPEDYCQGYDTLEFVFEAEGVKSFSSRQDENPRWIATVPCERLRRQPLFYRDFCEDVVSDGYKEDLHYMYENNPGFFPKTWYLKKINMFARSATSIPEEVLPPVSEMERYMFYCDRSL